MAIVPEPLTVYTGAHSRGSEVEMADLMRIKQNHGSTLPEGTSEHRAFDAAIMWKAARIEFSGEHYALAAKKLISSALKSPVDLIRYARVVLEGPIHHLLSPQWPVKPANMPSMTNAFSSHGPLTH